MKKEDKMGIEVSKEEMIMFIEDYLGVSYIKYGGKDYALFNNLLKYDLSDYSIKDMYLTIKALKKGVA